jgi:enterobactin synthetase component D
MVAPLLKEIPSPMLAIAELASRFDPFFSCVLPHFARQARLYLDGTVPAQTELIPLPAALADAIPKRQVQFRAGRYCAMKAMEALGPSYAGRSVARAASGAPLWPDGLVGSITHTDDFASAAVALRADAAALGIDTERIMTEPRARNVGRMIAWPSELGHARSAGLSRLEGMTLVFSAKESIFKCLHGLVGCYFDFHDVRIVEVDGQERTFVARLVKTLSESFPAHTLLRGTFDVESAWMHTGIALPPTLPIL